MLQAFTRNYKDESTDAGFQFTFCCDVCGDGYKSSFVQSETYKKKGLLRGLGQGASIAGSLLGTKGNKFGSAASRGSDVLSQRFEGKSPEWLKEHEKAFERCQNEAREHFRRCQACNKYVCDQCWNEDATLCVKCAPRQQVQIAQAHAQAMKRNIEQAGQGAVVWQGSIEQASTVCHACGKPAGAGKFCNNCGASMEMRECARCGAKNQPSVRFCNNCGNNMTAPPPPPPPQTAKCAACGAESPSGTRFCGGCGAPL
ncbi:MAG: zinc ribbon domain-containing protein [Oscillospiraceae bacterium]|nr:zinc ribbon domain-containing protein [Oscillospiraceae bacterium]